MLRGLSATHPQFTKARFLPSMAERLLIVVHSSLIQSDRTEKKLTLPSAALGDLAGAGLYFIHIGGFFVYQVRAVARSFHCHDLGRCGRGGGCPGDYRARRSGPEHI